MLKYENKDKAQYYNRMKNFHTDIGQNNG